MKIELIVIGKTANKHFATCIDDYVARIIHYLPFSVITIPDLAEAGNLSPEDQKEQDGAR